MPEPQLQLASIGHEPLRTEVDVPGTGGTFDFELTRREREILGLMAEGRSNLGIAGALGLELKTVEGHVGQIFSKLGLEPAASTHRRVEAVLTWLREGTATAGTVVSRPAGTSSSAPSEPAVPSRPSALRGRGLRIGSDATRPSTAGPAVRPAADEPAGPPRTGESATDRGRALLGKLIRRLEERRSR